MGADLLLGLDLGTSSLKAVLVEPEGRVLASQAVEYDILTPQPGWAEQDPEGWYQAAGRCIRQLLQAAQIDPAAVRGVGLSGQMHGLVPLDGQGQPLRPAIIWADSRSTSQLAALQQQIPAVDLARLTGNPLAAGFMLPSWLWLQDNEPEAARRTRTLLLPKDYLRFRLTGDLGAEPSDASSTGMFEPASRRWSTELLERLRIDPALLPPIGESAAVAGTLTRSAAAETGLKEGTPVVFGGSDQACQAAGHGVVTPGVMSSTIGTGGQLFAPLDVPLPDPQLRLHLFCHALPGRWHHQAAILAAGLALKWLRGCFFPGHTYTELADWAAQAPPGAEGLLFTPYLLGERTPHMDPHARGSLVGLSIRHGRSHIVRAVMEGVVYALRQGLELMLGLGGQVERVVASGGGVRHPLWLQLQADIYNRPIYRTTTAEAAALGAALLAGVGTGVYPDLEQACRQVVHYSGQAVEPVSRAAAYYEQAYSQYAGLYGRLKPG
jgi:xylulokinase